LKVAKVGPKRDVQVQTWRKEMTVSKEEHIDFEGRRHPANDGDPIQGKVEDN
jgi:hypothetical protein